MLIVSNYHYIREDFTSKYRSIFGLKPKDFENQLLELSKQGTFISQRDLLNYKEASFDKNYILITFDDGLSEQFELAKPILDRLGIPFVFFINTVNFEEEKVSMVHKVHMVRSELSSTDILAEISKNIKVSLSINEIKLAQVNYNYDTKETAILKYLLNFKLDKVEQRLLIDPLFRLLFNEKKVVKTLYFNKEQLKVLFDSDNLGSHSHNHVPLGYLSDKEIKLEFENTQSFFKKEFNQKAYSISYPYGSFEACNKVTELAYQYGFELGFSMERAANSNLIDNALMLSRYDCNDLPLSKSNIFGNRNIFKSSSLSKWYK